MQYTYEYMHHHKIIVIVAIFVGVLIFGAGAYGVWRQIESRSSTTETTEEAVFADEATWDNDPTKQEEQTTPDLSVDLGACTFVNKSAIESAVKPVVTVVGEPSNRGYGHESNGNESQTCTYTLGEIASIDNRFIVTVTKFAKDQAKKDSLTEAATFEAVAGIGQKAFFAKDAGEDESVDSNGYSLHVYKDLALYTFTIRQPMAKDVFTDQTAKTALESVAKTATF